LHPAENAQLHHPIVFLHGLASNRTRWNEFVRETALRHSHDLIAPDLRGHGASMTRRAFSLETWSDDLAAILDAEKRDRAIVVGHSMGAQAALHFALTHPKRVVGLVLIDPVFREAVVPAKRNYVRFGSLFQFSARVIRIFNRVGIHRGALPSLDLEALDNEARIALQDPTKLEAFVAKYSSAREDLKFIPHANYLQDMVEMFRPLPSFRTIACPVLVMRSTVAGYQDETIVAARIAEFSNANVQPIDCHHWPLTERPVEVRHMIEAWIAEKFHQ
jgi:esterase